MSKSAKNAESYELLIVFAIVISAAFFTDIFTFYKFKVNQSDYFSVVIGFVGSFGFYLNAQNIINNDSFLKFAFVGLGIFIASVIKQSFTNYDQYYLAVATLPLLFIGYFRLMLYFFYKDYPKNSSKPIVIFGTSLGQTNFNQKDKGYKPSMKEKLFSLLLFMGFIFFVLGFFLFLKNVL
jgi:hypothetical protein